MSDTLFCPIMVIGFDAPKNGATYDPRKCKKDCAWYLKTEKQCILLSINDKLKDTLDATADMLDNTGDIVDTILAASLSEELKSDDSEIGCTPYEGYL